VTSSRLHMASKAADTQAANAAAAQKQADEVLLRLDRITKIPTDIHQDADMTSRLHKVMFAACATMAAALALAQQAPSTSPATAQANTQAAAQPAQKTAADSKGADAQAADAAAAKKKADEVLLRDARNAGFKPEMIRGNRMFCRTATELGSSFPVRTCYDEEQVKIKIQEYQAQRNQMQANHNLGQRIE
jgi:hypothetical protein